MGVPRFQAALGTDIAGLLELTLYGLKGAAAYADHALALGYEDAGLYALFHEALDFLAGQPTNVDAILGWVLKAGELNLKVMELLDRANTETYGHPEPTAVKVRPIKGKAILVSGHDLKDLEDLLKQSEGKGVNVYTHGEMLPCHAYPGLKKYKHLVGNYGGAWQNQAAEFDAFPGPILMTTNCIQAPRETYKARIFTSGLVAWPGVQHVGRDRDFTPVIEAALAAPGFADDAPPKTITVGFGRNAVLGVADKVIDAVKAGQDPPLLPRRRLRRGQGRAELLYGVYAEAAQRLRDPHAGLRQVPLQQAGVRRHRRHPPLAGHWPVQRRLFGDPDRRGPGRGVPVRRERPAAVDGAELVRTEGGGHSAFAVAPGDQEHSPRSHSAGLRHARRVEGTGREVQYPAITTADADIAAILGTAV